MHPDHHRANGEREARAAREAYVQNAIETFPILAFDEPGARILASIDATSQQFGTDWPSRTS